MQITINSDNIIYIRAFLSSYEASNLFVERNKATLYKDDVLIPDEIIKLRNYINSNSSVELANLLSDLGNKYVLIIGKKLDAYSKYVYFNIIKIPEDVTTFRTKTANAMLGTTYKYQFLNSSGDTYSDNDIKNIRFKALLCSFL